MRKGIPAALTVALTVAAAAGLGATPTAASLAKHSTPAEAASLETVAATTTPAWAQRVPPATTQVVRTVSSNFWCDDIWCTVTQAWRRIDGIWTIQRHFRSTIGSRGWGKRREGDMRSPNGVYTIKVTFSTGRHAPGSMSWRKRKPTSAVSNTPGQLYNTWIEQKGRTDGDRPSMRYGFIVNYNHVRLRPFVGLKPVQGKGSGIFYHTSRPGYRWVPTEGCTQIGNVDNMRWLVKWLRPAAHPRIVQNL